MYPDHLKRFIMTLLTALIATFLSAAPVKADALRNEFANPSQEFGTDCWWWWLNGNVDIPAIDRDLEAMAGKGFYGAVIVDAGGQNQRGHSNVPAGPVFGSPDWCRLLSHALDKASSLGLIIGLNIQSGWNLGGPMVTPERAAKHLVTSKIELKSDSRGEPVALPLPPTGQGWYKDIAVLAVRDRGERCEGIYRLPDKLCDREVGFSTPDGSLLLYNEKPGPESALLASLDDIVDVTPYFGSDGILKWDAPEGDWTIVRAGYTCTGARVSTSSDTWQGLVIDYLSRDAFDWYWDTVMGPILEAAGSHVGNTFKILSTDSWECGGMNWTDGFEDIFRNHAGYEITPWLVSAAGIVVGSNADTHRFLNDFRKVIGSCIAHDHYGRFAERAHEHGMLIQPECAGPHGGPLDGIMNYGKCDIAMSEFWAMSPHRPTPLSRFFVKQASSAAHIYGMKIVGAEAFTTIGPQWNDLLWSNHKRAFDHEVCAGLNRVYFHTFTCSPEAMGRPGQEYFAGTHFNPNITWWDEASAYTDYIRRIQVIAQQGVPVNDILYYYGDHIPNIFPLTAPFADGYDFDVTDEQTLLGAKVSRGGIMLPSGRKYKVLLMPPYAVSEEASRKAKELSTSGASVATRNELLKVLKDKKIEPDCTVDGCLWVHYRFRDADFYYIVNEKDTPVTAEVSMLASGSSTEIWNPLDGSVRRTSFRKDGKRTVVDLELEAYGSRFVAVCRKKSRAPMAVSTPAVKEMALGGPWKVHFDPSSGGPGEIVMESLKDWTASDNTKYYSGKAVYRTTFSFCPEKGKLYRIRLGSVLDTGMASVRLNGKDLGVTWTAPFEKDITEALLEGDNKLEITVVNSWFNRVAGDQLSPEAVPFTKTNIRIVQGGKTPSLSPSGLMGPVEILSLPAAF